MSPTFIGLAALAVGFIACFHGYRIFRLLLPILGFVIGYTFGQELVPANQQTQVLLVAAVLGIIGFLLAYPFWSMGAALAGTALGFTLGIGLGQALAVGSTVALIIGVVSAVIFGLLFLNYKDVMVMLSTALNGAVSIVYGLGVLVPSLGLATTLSTAQGGVNRNGGLALIVILVIGAVGFLVQFGRFRNRRDYGR